jgi:hypothetical protein
MTSNISDVFDSGISDRPAAAPLPSIIDLARQAGAASLRADRLCDEGKYDQADYDRVDELRELLLTFRAHTLADAAAQMFAGFQAAEEMRDFDLPAEEQSRRVTAIRRAFLSALPVVGEAAGLDLAEIGAERIVDLAASELPADA